MESWFNFCISGLLLGTLQFWQWPRGTNMYSCICCYQTLWHKVGSMASVLINVYAELQQPKQELPNKRSWQSPITFPINVLSVFELTLATGPNSSILVIIIITTRPGLAKGWMGWMSNELWDWDWSSTPFHSHSLFHSAFRFGLWGQSNMKYEWLLRYVAFRGTHSKFSCNMLTTPGTYVW